MRRDRIRLLAHGIGYWVEHVGKQIIICDVDVCDCSDIYRQNWAAMAEWLRRRSHWKTKNLCHSTDDITREFPPANNVQ